MNLLYFFKRPDPLAWRLAGIGVICLLGGCANLPSAAPGDASSVPASTESMESVRVPVVNPKPAGPTIERDPMVTDGSATPMPVASVVNITAGPAAAIPGLNAKELVEALSSPLGDLNLLQNPIPPPLLKARLAPYHVDEQATCQQIKAEVAVLDTLLGPDVDASRVLPDETLVDVLTEEVGDAALGAIKGVTAGLMPFRSWIRRLSGAHRNAKEVGAAVLAGGARRAFLKGWLLGQKCE